jgi:HSP20 family protein
VVRPHFHSNAKEMLGEEFSKLLTEIAPFVEPRVDVYQTKDDFIISVDLAGARTEDISLKLYQNTLILKGTIKDVFGENTIRVINRERFFGSFKRHFLIPKDCILDRLHAEFSRGILMITIPFYIKENNQPQSIEINT